MPCRDYDNNDMSIANSYINQNNKLTDFLCTMCREFETRDIPLPTTAIEIWWQQHKREDKEREAKKRQEEKDLADKQNARKKLTRRERKLLGID
jgi:phage/plasmid-associated DNA primase